MHLLERCFVILTSLSYFEKFITLHTVGIYHEVYLPCRHVHRLGGVVLLWRNGAIIQKGYVTILVEKVKEYQGGSMQSVLMVHQSLFNPLNDEWTCPSLSFGHIHFQFRGIWSNFNIIFHFSMNFLLANRIALDGMQHYAASHLGLYHLPISHKKDARLI